MGIDLLLLGLGLGLLVVGGESLVRGSMSLAQQLGVPAILIGMTVVAFGTSTPELVVNLAAAAHGNSEIGFGNIIGSNIANIGLLLGLTALITPLLVHPSVVTREIPMMLLGCGAALALTLDRFLKSGGEQGTVDGLGRGDGVTLLLLFGVFLYYTFADALRQRADVFLEEVQTMAQPGRPRARWLAPVLVLVGLGVLILGGQMTVSGAVGLAEGLGMPQVVIGLTLVAVGTSLPELATCLIAARKKQADVAIGTIVGSNIYNLLFILGLTNTLSPAALPAGAAVDLLVMTGFSMVLLPLAMTHQRRLTRLEGGLLLVLYAGYVTWLAMRGG